MYFPGIMWFVKVATISPSHSRTCVRFCGMIVSKEMEAIEMLSIDAVKNVVRIQSTTPARLGLETWMWRTLFPQDGRLIEWAWRKLDGSELVWVPEERELQIAALYWEDRTEGILEAEELNLCRLQATLQHSGALF